MSEEYPLVTFALFAYNQEKYIREAVAGALAQDYPNLEIIISDDCSVDQTWAVIQRCAAEYSGPHHLTIRRNTENAGIADHVNAIFSMARGSLIVVAAGDDFSYPNRVRTMVAAWLDRGCPVAVVHAKARLVDAEGTSLAAIKGRNENVPVRPTIDDFLSVGFSALINGATAAYTPEIFHRLGPLQCDFEDVPLTFRGLLLGELIFVDQVLIDYRVGIGNASSHLERSNRDRIAAWCNAQISRVDQHSTDYMKFVETIEGSKPSPRLLKELERHKIRFQRALGLASPSILKNILGLLYLPVKGNWRDRLYIAAVYFGFKGRRS